MNIIRQVLLPILYRKGGTKRLQYYKFMQESQWNSLEENIQMQKKQLHDMLQYAFKNIPYYKNLDIDPNSFDPATICEDIKRIPFLTKKELRNELDNLNIVNSDAKLIYASTTGGSTGEPAKFMQDDYYRDWHMATKILFESWAGRKIGDPQIMLWGSLREVLEQREKIKHRLADWVRNIKLLNSFKMSKEDMKNFVKEINSYKPKLILAYVHCLHELAKFIDMNKLEIHSPRSIMSAAGVLYPKDRELIERVFECPVFNRYGSTEVGDIACDCEKHEGLHLDIFNLYIEIVDDNGQTCKPGEMGEVVVTTLKNYTMPLIRYKIGDMAVVSNKQCSCGRGLPIIDNVVGRNNSMIKTNKGVFNSIAINTLLRYYEDGIPFQSFSKYQVIQETKTDILMKVIITDHPMWIKEKARIMEGFQKMLGDDVEIVIQEVEHIDPLSSGKYDYIISKVED